MKIIIIIVLIIIIKKYIIEIMIPDFRIENTNTVAYKCGTIFNNYMPHLFIVHNKDTLLRWTSEEPNLYKIFNINSEIKKVPLANIEIEKLLIMPRLIEYNITNTSYDLYINGVYVTNSNKYLHNYLTHFENNLLKHLITKNNTNYISYVSEPNETILRIHNMNVKEPWPTRGKAYDDILIKESKDYNLPLHYKKAVDFFMSNNLTLDEMKNYMNKNVYPLIEKEYENFMQEQTKQIDIFFQNKKFNNLNDLNKLIKENNLRKIKTQHKGWIKDSTIKYIN
ncbi:MAG: hypothetical protein Q4F88_05360 [Eubacteriales bacterium]|nr:hypothetical protein [Eubacteriales bacterium]